VTVAGSGSSGARVFQSSWPVRAFTAAIHPRSSPAKSTESAPASGVPSGITGDREWETPVRAWGTQSAGQAPPVLPRSTAWTVRSFDITRTPYAPTAGGTTAVAPVE